MRWSFSASSAPETETTIETTEQADVPFRDYIGLTFPGYEFAPHNGVLIDHLEAVERGDIDRLIVMEPPRHGKSELVSVRFPAWYLGRHPEHQMILASYGATLAQGFSSQAKDQFEHPDWPFLDVSLARSSKSKGNWRTTVGGVPARNGGLLAGGVGGSQTGAGAHVLVIDDYLKNWEQAASETIRENQWNWYTSTARTRLMPRGRIIVTATRWHEDDLIGRILNGTNARNRWTILHLPAIADGKDWTGREDAPDALGRAPGEALWPGWYDAVALAEIKDDVGPRVWTSLYQGRPTAADGSTFKRQWMSRRYGPELLAEKLGQFAFVISSTDTNYKEGTGHDPSVVAVWATDNVDYYLLDVWRAQTEFPELKRAISDMHAKWATHADLVEEAANGAAAIAELKRETTLALIPIKPVKSKAARADSVAPIFEAGKVVLPLEAPWLMDWIEEHCAFPNGMHDDQVDTTSQALARLSGRDAAGFLTFVQQEAMRRQAERAERRAAPDAATEEARTSGFLEGMRRHKEGAA